MAGLEPTKKTYADDRRTAITILREGIQSTKQADQ